MEEDRTRAQIQEVIKNHNSGDPMNLMGSDHPDMVVSAPLVGKNFRSWQRAIRIALGAKQKLGFIHGTIPVPDEGSEAMVDYMVIQIAGNLRIKAYSRVLLDNRTRDPKWLLQQLIKYNLDTPIEIPYDNGRIEELSTMLSSLQQEIKRMAKGKAPMSAGLSIQSHTGSSPINSATNYASNFSQVSALFAKEYDNSIWIIDRGAPDHMTHALHLFESI
ncbi:hypothetical protein GH714_030406 [Hevea brasiliensis]|uniref:Retrotransposon Copia-like N-terminal domain-containing protein n=1 Tax=Hevea brasiliensis TaxID=3981 RepID=A0A6A6LDH7_HEVBR|nr:hypothetical protein GH714_030406 [Hevea brasiliensis]